MLTDEEAVKLAGSHRRPLYKTDLQTQAGFLYGGYSPDFVTLYVRT